MIQENYEKDISGCEKLVMKIVWDYDGDITTQEVIEEMKTRFGKDYARSTVVTMLQRLMDKGYVSSYRKGRISYIHALKDEEQYKANFLVQIEDFWFKGETSSLLSALCKTKKPSELEIERMRKLIDELDN